MTAVAHHGLRNADAPDARILPRVQAAERCERFDAPEDGWTGIVLAPAMRS